jgi:hypothetical protein
LVDLKGSPWTAWISSGVSNLQAKSSAGAVDAGVDATTAAEGDGDGEVVTTGAGGFEQLAAAAREAIRTTRKRKAMT